MAHQATINPIRWILTLYFFQSIPFVVVSLISSVFYQQMGLSRTHITLITSSLLLPWALKPLVAPMLEKGLSKKQLTVVSELVIATLFVLIAYFANSDALFLISLAVFILLACCSSVHDIVSDGVYLLNLDSSTQARYVGHRSCAYQLGRLLIKGSLLTLIASAALAYALNPWQLFFLSLGLMSFCLGGYHLRFLPEKELVIKNRESWLKTLSNTLSNKALFPALLFIFFFHITEAQIQKVMPLFLLDDNGLHLSLAQLGERFGIYGNAAFLIGIFLGASLIHRLTISRGLYPLTVLLLFGHGALLILSYLRPDLTLITAAIVFNQLCAGMSNAGFMSLILSTANKSAFPMSFYTMCTSLMALSFVVFGALSGLLVDALDYQYFFILIFLANLALITYTKHMLARHAL